MGDKSDGDSPEWSSAGLLHLDDEGNILHSQFFGEDYQTVASVAALDDGTLLVVGSKNDSFEDPDGDNLNVLWIQKLKPVGSP